MLQTMPGKPWGLTEASQTQGCVEHHPQTNYDAAASNSNSNRKSNTAIHIYEIVIRITEIVMTINELVRKDQRPTITTATQQQGSMTYQEKMRWYKNNRLIAKLEGRQQNQWTIDKDLWRSILKLSSKMICAARRQIPYFWPTSRTLMKTFPKATQFLYFNLPTPRSPDSGLLTALTNAHQSLSQS